ncbi:DUF4328 domain-containing protein [Streptomyces sp. NPDC001606]
MTSPMPAAPPFTPGAVLRSPVGLGRAAATLLGVVIAADLFAVVADWMEFSVSGELLGGATGSAVIHRADRADTVYNMAGLCQGITLLAAAVVYLCWLWRVRVNAEVFRPDLHRMRRGWTIGGWFCPIVNLWFPRRIVEDVWDASLPLGSRTGRAPVTAWWTLWISTMLLGRVAYTVYSRADDPTTLRNAAALMLLSDAVDAAAAALAIVVVVHLTRMQHQKALYGPAPAPLYG